MPRARDDRQYEAAWKKLTAVPGMVVTIVLSLLLLAASLRGSTFTTGVDFVQSNRDSVAIIVQVVSVFFGILNSWALQKALTLSARQHWEYKAFPLNTLKFINALHTFLPDWSTPLPTTGLILALFVIGQLPGALWAGAITPVVVSQNTSLSINVTTFTNNTWLTQGSPPDVTNQLGIFSYEPQYLLQGLLLSEAARASPTNRNWRHPLGNTHYHAKLDNSGFNFANRSHGVGYSVGLVDNFTSDALAYSYEEIGLSPQVYCIYNSSSNLVFSNMLDTGLGNPDVALWQVGGTLPNAVSVAGLATEVDAEPPVFIASGTRNTSYVSFAVGVPNPGVKSFYDALNQTQCQIEMRPTLFTVSVDLTNNTITVIPVQGRDPPHEPASASLLFSKVVSTLGAISYITATSLGTSPFGNAFINNIFQSGATDPQQRRQAITDSLTNMLDNTLLIINSAQLLLMPNNVAVPVNVSRPALQFGTPVYIYLVVASQVVVWLIYVGELIRTRFWHGVTEFDFLDPTKILLAASGGGLAVAEAAQQKRLQIRPHVRKDEESDIDRIKVRLEHEVDGKVDGPILVLDGTPLPQHRRTESTEREDRERLEAQTHESVPGDQPSQSDEGAPRIDVNIPLQRMRSMLTISPSSPLRPSYQRLGNGVEEHGA